MSDQLAIDDPRREQCVLDPPDLPMFAENFMLSAYDPTADVGMWLHLGTWPEDFGLWEDWVTVNLPDDVLWMSAYNRRVPVDGPGGSNLRFTLIEPWKRWKVTFDGIVYRTPRVEMLEGRLRDGQRERLTFAFDVENVTPIWDAKSSASDARGSGSMEEQVWAKDHYQQLFRYTGWMDLHGEGRVAIDTTGVRDHSRGQRGHDMDRWGGHTLIHVLFPSGKAFAVQTMWDPDGNCTLDTAYVLIDGQMMHASGIEVPRLERVALDGDQMRLVLESDLGRHELVGEIVRTAYFTPQRLGMAMGADPAGPYGMFAMAHGRWEWDGEVAYGLTERSAVGLTHADFVRGKQ